MKAHGGYGCKGVHTYVYTATALGKCRVASTKLGRLYPDTHIIVGWMDPRNSLDMKEWRKSPPLRHPGRQAHSQAPCRLSHMTPYKTMTWIQSALSHLKETYNYIRCNICKTTMPVTLFVSKKGTSSLSLKTFINIRVESCIFAACIWTCPVYYLTPHTLVHNTKDSFCSLWSASWVVFSLQRRRQHSSAANPAAASKQVHKNTNKCMKNSFKIIEM